MTLLWDGGAQRTATEYRLAGALSNQRERTRSEQKAKARERSHRRSPSLTSVAVHTGDGAGFEPGPCGASLVNCGVTHPQSIWRDRLPEGGRLIVPFWVAINPTIGQGILTKIMRQRGRYPTDLVSPVALFAGGNLCDLELELMIRRALRSGGLLKLKSVRRDAHEPADTCVLEVCLSISDSPATARS